MTDVIKDHECSNPRVGFKITDMHGDRGVIVGIGGDHDGVTWDPDNLLGNDKFKERLGQLDTLSREGLHAWVCDLDINSMYWQTMQAHDIKRTTHEKLFKLKVQHSARCVIYRTYKRHGHNGVIYRHVPWPILKTYP